MIRCRDGREILALDLECRYGKDDPLVREVRASIPKDRAPRIAPSMVIALSTRPVFPTRAARREARPGYPGLAGGRAAALDVGQITQVVT